ncbi:hypothetical protein BCR33DRAFT_714608 [Rhizoclosmatium globosum]|uniref:Uncharacterized protein n=1 Tax=Rhizoclosmatium globosum TaxID=329046 RepID=A0A1Y2CMZ5_9FUNG|nr:hypothetical protein BCR33DRAFT_714608 [Rhizoclosmatium globosum]|eukprot:ORY48204.1 hypothetical protein BCR33DRAFT_714608 [Rhizoclosmatium globosum]
MTSTNSTLTLDFLDTISTPVNFFLMGLCVEVSFAALLDLTPRLVTAISQTRNWKELPVLLIFLISINLCLILNNFFDMPAWFPEFMTQDGCVGINFIDNLLWHIFFVLFDTFILWKSWIVTDKNRLYLAACIVAMGFRLSTGILDLVWTTAYWDSQVGCVYNQSDFSTMLYTAADAVCDAIATLGALTMFLKSDLGGLLSFETLWFRLLKENVFRSGLTLIICSIVMFMSRSPLVPLNILYMSFSAQQYIYIRLANLELHYKDERKVSQTIRITAPDASTRKKSSVAARQSIVRSAGVTDVININSDSTTKSK